MKETDLLVICVKKIEEKVKWGTPSQWADRDFIQLSEQLQEVSGVYISKNTLKNVFRKIGKDSNYTPQKATRNALVQFLGYENWNTFRNEQNQKQQEIKSGNKKPGFPKMRKKYLLYSVGIVLLLLTLFFGIQNLIKPGDTYSIQFKAGKHTGYAPLTVRFKYNIENLAFDSIYIDHSYEHHNYGYQIFGLDKNRKFINHCYQIPDVYHVRLIANNQILAKERIYVLSKGWIGLVSNRFSKKMEHKGKLQPPEFKHLIFNLHHIFKNPVHNGMLYIPTKNVEELGINKRFYWTEFRNIRDFHSNGDSAIFEIKFRNNAKLGGISCFDSQFIFIGDSSFLKVTLVEPGCYRYANAIIGYNRLAGDIDDLSSFQHNLSRWRILKITVANRTVSFYMDNELFYEKKYTLPIGLLKGLVFSFKGSGAIDFVKIYNLKKKILYQNDFEQKNH